MKKLFIAILIGLIPFLVYAAVDTWDGQTAIDTWDGQTGVDTIDGQTVASGSSLACPVGNWFCSTWHSETDDPDNSENGIGESVWDTSTATASIASTFAEGTYALQVAENSADYVLDNNGGSYWNKTDTYVRFAYRWTSITTSDKEAFAQLSDESVSASVIIFLIEADNNLRIEYDSNGAGNWVVLDEDAENLTQNTWYQFEVHWKSDPGGGTGEVGWRMWAADGTLINDDNWVGGENGWTAHSNTEQVDVLVLGCVYSASRDDVGGEYDVYTASDSPIGAYQ